MATPPEYTSLVQKLQQLGIDIALLRQFVQGTEVETVVLGEVETPSLRKLAHDIDERESRAAQVVVDKGIADQVALKIRTETLVARAEDAVTTIHGVTAAAQTLEPGSAATAAYNPDNGRLSFGIPRGDQGAAGPIGPAGQAPAIDTIDFGEPGQMWLGMIDFGEIEPA